MPLKLVGSALSLVRGNRVSETERQALKPDKFLNFFALYVAALDLSN
jgi:hypothetical protein